MVFSIHSHFNCLFATICSEQFYHLSLSFIKRDRRTNPIPLHL